jgi:hypothetical protein
MPVLYAFVMFETCLKRYNYTASDDISVFLDLYIRNNPFDFNSRQVLIHVLVYQQAFSNHHQDSIIQLLLPELNQVYHAFESNNHCSKLQRTLRLGIADIRSSKEMAHNRPEMLRKTVNSLLQVRDNRPNQSMC